MFSYKSVVYKVWSKITKFISKIHWENIKAFFNGGKRYNITAEDKAEIRKLLSNNYYMILTHRNAHLSSQCVSFLTWAKTGKWPTYTHILMNFGLSERGEFRLIEATNKGVHFSSFDEVFNADSVCLLDPTQMSKREWKATMKGLANQLGKKYDNFFNISDNEYVSCVEVVLDSLRQSPGYENDFQHLEKMIKEVGNLTPQMYRDCEDFHVVFEVKR